MTEHEIAERLQQTVAPMVEPTTAPPPEPNTTNGQATTDSVYEIDELLQYKLHDLFSEPYRANDQTARQQMTYIYQEVCKLVEDQDYGYVAAKIRELQRIIGISEGENQRYRLYQWLRLDNTRRGIDAEMEAIRG